MQPIVYVVEDDADVRSSMCALVEALGYQARAFADADSFLAAGLFSESASPRCCIVTDLKLPGTSGIEMIENLRRQGVSVPAIMMSASGMLPASRAAKAGIVAMLRKPLAADALSQWLEQVFTR